MHVDAIVYTSNMGSTRRYAEALGKETGLPVYALQDARRSLKPGDSLLYLGWLMAGQVQGLKKAREMYRVEAVCAVGMGMNMEEETLRKGNGLEESIPVFPLFGDLEPEKLGGVQRWLVRFLGNALRKKQNPTEEEKRQGEMLLRGDHLYNAQTLAPVLDWYRSK